MGLHRQVVVGEVATPVLDFRLPPPGAERVEALVRSGPSVLKRSLEEIELLTQGSHSHTQDDATPGEEVDGSIPLEQFDGMVVAEHHHVRRQEDVGGESGDPSQCPHRIPVDDAAPFPLSRGHPDVLAAGQVVIAEPISGDYDPPQLFRSGGLLPPRVPSRSLNDNRGVDAEIQGT